MSIVDPLRKLAILFPTDSEKPLFDALWDKFQAVRTSVSGNVCSIRNLGCDSRSGRSGSSGNGISSSISRFIRVGNQDCLGQFEAIRITEQGSFRVLLSIFEIRISGGNVYRNRPCQYESVRVHHCCSYIWTSRFSVHSVGSTLHVDNASARISCFGHTTKEYPRVGHTDLEIKFPLGWFWILM